jgi:hypothetical protein
MPTTTDEINNTRRQVRVPERMAEYHMPSMARRLSKQPNAVIPMTKRQAKAYAVLNLDLQGAPLTYGTAKKDQRRHPGFKLKAKRSVG